MAKVWILVGRDHSGRLTSLYSPDLDRDLFPEFQEKCSQSNTDYRSFLQRKLVKNRALINNKLVKFSELKDFKITILEHWERLDIELPKKISLMGRALPVAGYFLSLFAIVANAYIAYMALRITTHDEEHSASSIGFSILATIFRSLINFFIYVMSGASDTLQDFGETLSNSRKIKNIKNALVVANPNQSKWRNCAASGTLALTSFGAGASIVTNISINTIILFQEGIGLTERYLKLYPALSASERELYYQLIKWIVVVSGTMAGNYCELAFEGNFAIKLIEKLKARLTGQSLSSTNPHRFTFNRLQALPNAQVHDAGESPTEQRRLIEEDNNDSNSLGSEQSQPEVRISAI